MPEQEKKLDIKNLKEVVDFGFAAEKAGVDILGNGFHPEKLGELLPLIGPAKDAFEGIEMVPSELADLDEAEVTELIAHVAAKGVLPAKAEEVLDKSLRVAWAAWELYQVVKG